MEATATDLELLFRGLESTAALLTVIALIVGGIVGLRRYRHGLKIKAGELLLQMEQEFREIAPTCLLWETLSSYNTRVKPVLDKNAIDAAMSDQELQLLANLDRCLRFFYLCTVLHTDLKVERAVVARSYYWYASLLLDGQSRPELAEYVRIHYRRLYEWLQRHRVCFQHYRDTGRWRECDALPAARVRNG